MADTIVTILAVIIGIYGISFGTWSLLSNRRKKKDLREYSSPNSGKAVDLNNL